MCLFGQPVAAIESVIKYSNCCIFMPDIFVFTLNDNPTSLSDKDISGRIVYRCLQLPEGANIKLSHWVEITKVFYSYTVSSLSIISPVIFHLL